MIHPLVSVIVPSYNHERYVVETLNSIIADTYPNKEIIIINDGSCDNSDHVITEWIKLYQNELPIRYLNRENKGLNATLNQLVALSTGKYLLLIASDDVLYGNTLMERVKLLEENEESGKLVLVSDALVIDEKSEVIMQSSMSDYNRGDKSKYKTEDGIIEEVIMNPSISGATLLINKQIYSITGEYPEDLKAEDWYFYQRAAAVNAILFLDKAVSCYRVHSSNTSGSAASLSKQLGLTKSIVNTFQRNYKKFPTLKFKLMAISQLFRFLIIYYKLKIKKLLANH